MIVQKAEFLLNDLLDHEFGFASEFHLEIFPKKRAELPFTLKPAGCKTFFEVKCLHRPSIFPMANGGVGLAGGAGSEAIMPLFRGSGGDLGVKTSGSRSVEVNVYAPPGSKVSQNQKSMGDRDQINILIDEAVAGSVKDSGSKTHRALKNSFGLRQSLTTR